MYDTSSSDSFGVLLLLLCDDSANDTIELATSSEISIEEDCNPIMLPSASAKDVRRQRLCGEEGSSFPAKNKISALAEEFEIISFVFCCC